MGLPGDNITTWAQMQRVFNKKYMDYCRSKETKEEIFRMTLGLNESLKEYEERFHLSYRRARCALDPKSLKLFLLQGIMEDMIKTLNMFSEGDIYYFSYEDIKIVFKNHSRVARKKGRASQDLVGSSPSTTSIKNEIGNMLEEFKLEMFHTFSFQMDTM